MTRKKWLSKRHLIIWGMKWARRNNALIFLLLLILLSVVFLSWFFYWECHCLLKWTMISIWAEWAEHSPFGAACLPLWPGSHFLVQSPAATFSKTVWWEPVGSGNGGYAAAPRTLRCTLAPPQHPHFSLNNSKNLETDWWGKQIIHLVQNWYNLSFNKTIKDRFKL